MTSHGADGTAYDLSGPPDAPAVVLIHGLGLCREIWEPFVPALASRFRVLSYDLYGHGESAPPQAPATLKTFASQIAGLMDETGILHASIVGFSIGGMINRRFAMDYPDRARGLVILNSPHDRGAKAQAMVEARAAKVRDQGVMATLDDALIRWFTPAFRAGADGPAKVRNWRARVDPESYAQAAWVLANGVRELIRPDPPLTLPTLVMTCENDSGSTPAMSLDIAAEIPGADVDIIPDLQHLGLMEDVDAFLGPITEFLERNVS